MDVKTHNTVRKPDEARRKIIIVSGMHRSGTSALTRVFNMMGGTLPLNIMPATDFNVSGHFESNILSFLNDDILTELGLTWSDIGEIEWPALDSKKRSEFRRRLMAGIAQEFPKGSLLIIKDPRIGRLLPLWKEVLEQAEIDPSFVLPIRHPLEVAHSLKRRDGFPLGVGCLLWLRYVLEAELNTRGLNRAFSNYAELLSAPTQIVARIAATLGNELPISTAGVEPEIASFIDSGLRHHTVDRVELTQSNSLGPWIDQAYAAFTQLIADPNDSTAQAQLDHIHEDFRRYANAFAPLVSFERKQSAMAAEKWTAQLADLHRQLIDEAAQLASTNANLAEQIVRATSAETDLATQAAQTASLETLLAEQAVRAGSIETRLAGQTARATKLEQNLSAEVARTASLDAQLREQTDLLTSQKTITDAQSVQVKGLEQIEAEQEARIVALLTSHSWRVTAPLRAIKRLLLFVTSGS